jgi:NAD-reducing hydrogenase small subunit
MTASSESTTEPGRKVRLATVWLDGCSGCHMSFLDMDERLLELAPLIELVYSPLVDAKSFPENVDVALIEGSVSTDEDIEHIREIRKRTNILVSLGDCAVTGNVPAMRNQFSTDEVFDRAYIENAQLQQQRPTKYLPTLLEKVLPVHEVVKVDIFVPGCPPPADAIYYVVSELLAGRTPNAATVTRFGR